MTSTARKTPRLLVRSAQAAIAAAAVTDVFRAVAVRDNHLHDTDASESGLVSMVFVYVTTLAIVLFLVWLAQARRNAEELSPEASVPSRGRTIGMWFVPFAHLFVPRKVVLDIGRASSASWDAKRETTLVNAWWAAWITHSLVLVFAGRLAPGSLVLLVVEEVLMIAAAVLAGLVIERITALQDAALGVAVPAEPLAQA
jgi:integral membrane sensor domain MASE1